MTPVEFLDLFMALAKFAYNVGLLVLGTAFVLLVLRFVPQLILVARDAATALNLFGSVLRDSITSHEAISRLSLQVDELHAALVRVPRGSTMSSPPPPAPTGQDHGIEGGNA